MNQRGSTVIEFTASAVFVVVLVGATCTAAYAAFGRALIEYRAEQSLYCLAEGRGGPTCRRTLMRTLRDTLPYGRLSEVHVHHAHRQWEVKLKWTLSIFKFSVAKSLSPRRILRPADLHS